MNRIFAGTTVDVNQVLLVLGKDTNRKIKRVNNEEQLLLEYADYCEYLFQLYLTGTTQPTTEDVCLEVGYFLEFEPMAAPLLLLQAFDSVRKILLDKEWYEFLPACETLRRNVRQQFNI